jgi:uncharacterized membrane protein (DUF485 family)
MQPGADYDWEAIERSAEFQELVRRKRRYVLPRVVFFLAWYLGFILLAGYAEDFMNERVYEGLTVGYCLALSQFVMVWVLAATYIRKADRDFDPLEEKAVAHLRDQTRDGSHTPTGRVEPEETPAASPVAPTPEVRP